MGVITLKKIIIGNTEWHITGHMVGRTLWISVFSYTPEPLDDWDVAAISNTYGYGDVIKLPKLKGRLSKRVYRHRVQNAATKAEKWIRKQSCGEEEALIVDDFFAIEKRKFAGV